MSVRFRADRNKWQVSVFIHGKRVRPLFGSKREAQDFEREAKLRRQNLRGFKEPITLAEAFKSFLEIESAQKTKANAKADERFFEIVRHFLGKERGLQLVEEVGVEDLQRLQLWLAPARQIGPMTKDDWSDTTIAHHCKVLKTVFKKLLAMERIQKNPAAHWTIPAGESEKRRPMTAEEFGRIYELASERERAILLTMRLTGARGASIAALTWGEINLTDCTMLLRSRKGGRKKVKTVVIPIFPALLEALTKIWNQHPSKVPNAAVFLDENDRPVSAHWISVRGSRLIQRAGLKGVVLYGLRHALATDLIAAGVSGEITRQIMGHSDERQLKEYTSHLELENLSKALVKIRGQT